MITFYEYAKVKVRERDRRNWFQKVFNLGYKPKWRVGYMPSEMAFYYQAAISTYYDVELKPMPKGWKPKDREKIMEEEK